jgi:hypothetical protein
LRIGTALPGSAGADAQNFAHASISLRRFSLAVYRGRPQLAAGGLTMRSINAAKASKARRFSGKYSYLSYTPPHATDDMT